MKHKKPLIAFSVIAISLLAGSAFAGPDWAAIERARAAKQAEQVRSAKEAGCPQQSITTQEQHQNRQNPHQPK